MASYGYGGLLDRSFVSFDSELDQGAWKAVATKKYEESGHASAAELLGAPHQVVWKLRLRWGIAGVLSALGAKSLGALDDAWDASQRRLFYRIAIGVDDEDGAVRASADRLRAQLLSGEGTAQTKLDYNAEVDFGRKQVALTQDSGALASDAKKLKLGDVLADVSRTTEALATGLGRGSGTKRQPPSRQLREALAECASAFNGVHDSLAWFIARTPAGPDREQLEALQAPLEALLARHAPTASATADAAPPGPADPVT